MAITTEEQKPPSFGIKSFLFAVVLTLLFYMLALNMVHQGFFRGGRPDPPKGVPTQTNQ